MKKIMMAVALAGTIAGGAIGGFSDLAQAEENVATSWASEYPTLIVNGHELEAEQGAGAYTDERSGAIMVPLRAVAQALGYKVAWLPEEASARIEDSIQSAKLRLGSDVMVATGKLQVIDLSGEVELESVVVQKNGHIYVPARAFEKFLNDVTIEKGTVSISPQMSELQSDF
ncbi:stalk domain-containing protein [Saccharibacillus sacchari]|uniref:Stalk domain-containing protein n=1 Tax=Saccharibacillus sacchari TaxID=456493 RepID=A0ACC6PEH8_9BACL